MKRKNVSQRARRKALVGGVAKRRVSLMDDRDFGNLSARITNCLQTILELEPDLERLQMGHVLVKEFQVLKTFLSKIERIDIEEQDVRRIETATETFLRELKSPLAVLELERVRKHLVQ